MEDAPAPAAANGGGAVPLAPTALAWVCVLAVAVPFALVAWLLGPTLGHAWQASPQDFFADPRLDYLIRPEPTELTRALIAIAAPLVAAAAVLLLAGRPLPERLSRLAAPVAIAVQLVALALAGASVLKREIDFADADLATFSTGQLIFAAAFAIAAALLAADQRPRAWLARAEVWAGRPAPRIGVAVAVAIVTALWLLPTVFTEGTLGAGQPYVWNHLQFIVEDFAAVVNGATPMVDYSPQYSALLPYVFSAPFGSLGPAALSQFFGALSLLTMLALYGTVRNVVPKPLAAAALYLPVLALSLLPVLEAGDQLANNATTYQIIPLRYLGPFTVAWLLARRLAGRQSLPPVALFALAGLVIANNSEFGVPAFGALAVAILLADDRPGASSWPARLVSVGRDALIGALIATTVIVALVLIRSGELPSLSVWFTLARLVTGQGWYVIAMPDFGLFVFIYLLLATAVLVAAVRAVSAPERDRPLTGMLSFAGTFGLGAGLYYVGRSAPEQLVSLYPVWGLTVALLAWTVLHRDPAASWPGPSTPLTRVGAMVAVFALGLMITTVVNFPAPWTQIDRLRADRVASPLDHPERVAFVRSVTDPGDDVVILASMGHYIAEQARVDDRSPLYVFQVISHEQLDRALEALDRSGGDTLFTTSPQIPPAESVYGFANTGLTAGAQNPLWKGFAEALEQAGWRPVATDPAAELTAWSKQEG